MDESCTGGAATTCAFQKKKKLCCLLHEFPSSTVIPIGSGVEIKEVTVIGLANEQSPAFLCLFCVGQVREP